MTRKRSKLLGFFSLLFLLPGLAGLVLSAITLTGYEENLPRMPDPTQARMTPRDVDGVVVYQTKEEDRRLTVTEDASGGVFLIGLTLGLMCMPVSLTSSPHQLQG